MLADQGRRAIGAAWSKVLAWAAEAAELAKRRARQKGARPGAQRRAMLAVPMRTFPPRCRECWQRPVVQKLTPESYFCGACLARGVWGVAGLLLAPVS